MGRAEEETHLPVLVKTVMNPGIPQPAANFLTSFSAIIFSRRAVF
jgi:hypothetical protein